MAKYAYKIAEIGPGPDFLEKGSNTAKIYETRSEAEAAFEELKLDDKKYQVVELNS